VGLSEMSDPQERQERSSSFTGAAQEGQAYTVPPGGHSSVRDVRANCALHRAWLFSALDG
jgi:hypothetical protein